MACFGAFSGHSFIYFIYYTLFEDGSKVTKTVRNECGEVPPGTSVALSEKIVGAILFLCVINKINKIYKKR